MEDYNPNKTLLPPATDGGAAITPMRGGGSKTNSSKSKSSKTNSSKSKRPMKGGGSPEDDIANKFLRRVLMACESDAKAFAVNDKTLTKTTETIIR